jgi:hypothetical protein
MPTEPIVDHGQKISPPAGKVIGFLDGQAEYEAFAADVQAAGYPARAITSLYGDDGIHLLERLKESRFFFGDSEDSVIKLSLRGLNQGHNVAAVEVAGRDEAVQIERLAEPHGGHGFSYFGTWVTEQLSS